MNRFAGIKGQLGKTSIRWRLAAPAALVAIIATTMVSYSLTNRNVALVKKATIEDARSDVSYAAAKVQYATFLHDSEMVAESLREVLSANPPLIFAEVRDSEGAVLSAAGKTKLASNVILGSEVKSQAGQGSGAGVSVRAASIPKAGLTGYYAVAPVALVGKGDEQDDPFNEVLDPAQKPTSLGEVRLFFSDGGTKAAIASLRTDSLVIAAVLALLVAVASFVFASRLVRPIHALLGATQRVAEGDLEVVLQIDRQDELGVLARSFNRMALDLKKSYDQLNEYSTDLEVKVAERTHELADANSELEAQHTALQDSNRRLSMINSISKSVTRSIHIQDVLQTALAQVIRAVEAQAGAIHIWDATERHMNLEAWSGLARDHIDRWRIVEADNELLRGCLASAKPVVAADSLPEAATLLASLRESDGIEQIWFVPLRSAGTVVGLIELAFDRVVVATPANTEPLVAVSRQVGTAVANAKLFEQTRAQAAALEAANHEMAAINEQLMAANEELRGANQTITDQHTTLIRAAKMASMGTLAAGIAHEINNPLAIIAGYSEALLEKIEAAGIDEEGPLRRLEQYLRVINSECFRCKEITQGLLTLAREGELARNSGNVNICIGETIALMNFHRDHDARSVVLDLDEHLPDIACDPNQLRQVFLNLALNAMDAMGPLQKLHIKTSSEDGWIQVEFRDEGAGIKPEILDRIFDAFFTTKPEGSGTGLGLAMCQAIIEQHEGTIDVSSVLGEGTTFTIRLPIKEVPTESAEEMIARAGEAAA